MAESVTIARPYAEALFRVAKESGNLVKWSESVTKLGQLAANPEEIGRASCRERV